MSEKRFDVRFSEKWGRHMIHDNGEPIDNVPVMDLLNEQAETIQVLQEWIRKCGQKLVADEREIIENAEFSSPEDLLEAKRRIAALEGK